jgi:hypothetical protein
VNITEERMNNPVQFLVNEGGSNIYFSYKLKGGSKNVDAMQVRLIQDKIREGGDSLVAIDGNEYKQQVEIWYYKNKDDMKKIRDVEITSYGVRKHQGSDSDFNSWTYESMMDISTIFRAFNRRVQWRVGEENIKVNIWWINGNGSFQRAIINGGPIGKFALSQPSACWFGKGKKRIFIDAFRNNIAKSDERLTNFKMRVYCFRISVNGLDMGEGLDPINLDESEIEWYTKTYHPLSDGKGGSRSMNDVAIKIQQSDLNICCKPIGKLGKYMVERFDTGIYYYFGNDKGRIRDFLKERQFPLGFITLAEIKERRKYNIGEELKGIGLDEKFGILEHYSSKGLGMSTFIGNLDPKKKESAFNLVLLRDSKDLEVEGGVYKVYTKMSLKAYEAKSWIDMSEDFSRDITIWDESKERFGETYYFTGCYYKNNKVTS